MKRNLKNYHHRRNIEEEGGRVIIIVVVVAVREVKGVGDRLLYNVRLVTIHESLA